MLNEEGGGVCCRSFACSCFLDGSFKKSEGNLDFSRDGGSCYHADLNS